MLAQVRPADNPNVPHGFLVLAMCEALRGDADSGREGLVTVGDLPRAADLASGIGVWVANASGT